MTLDQFRQFVIDHLGDRYSPDLELGVEALLCQGIFEWDAGPENFYYHPEAGWTYSNPDAEASGKTLRDAVAKAGNNYEMRQVF
jgi:hypothetical protein